jgi:predicted deacylase
MIFSREVRMPSAAETISLPGAMPGTARQLRVFSFGDPGAQPKAYLQAGLHADEPSGMMILRELCKLLAAAEDAGEVRARSWWCRWPIRSGSTRRSTAPSWDASSCVVMLAGHERPASGKSKALLD